MDMVAQGLGIVITILCILHTQLKQKQHMLLVSFAANFLNVIVFFLLQGITSAMMVCLTASVQCAVNCFLAYRNKEASIFQKILFTILYLVSGAMQYTAPLDLLPILASLLFMLAVFQKNEQRLRLFCAFNGALWIVYDSIVGTTAVWGQVFSLISVLIALYRYRKRKETQT